MKAMKIIALSLMVFGGVFPSCSSEQSASSALRSMKPEKYFIIPAQVELAKAVIKQDLQGIDAAIAKGANVNKVGKEEMTPLAWAFSKQKKASFQRLLEKGANPNFKTKKVAWNNDGRSVMQFAALAEDPDYLKLVLKYGGNPNAPSKARGRTIIYTSIKNHRTQNIKTLVEFGADINHQDEAGFTPIMAAKSLTKYDLVFLLMNLGADLSKRHHLITANGDKKNGGKTLAESIQHMGDRSIRVLGLEKEQREWYNKVIAELKSRGLL
ncbi:MAG: ankyrin repeat domain-containing protein [Verrucomicrobiota bacterium JB023]|nr:ankyrin repeat domain-containing protein [Verrucomicrobiota bacterium JB023]